MSVTRWFLGSNTVRDRPTIDLARWRADYDLLSITIREALDALSPGAVADSDLWGYIGGNNEQRRPRPESLVADGIHLG